MEISNILKELRLEHGLTQKDVANKLNIRIQSYNRYEAGTRAPNKEALENIANIFDVSLGYLLGETKVKQSSKLLNISEQLNEDERNEVISFAHKKIMEREDTEKKLNDYVKLHLTSVPPKPLHLDFAQKLNLLLAEHKLSQANLSRLLGVSRQTVTNYISGNAKPTQEHLEKLSDVFDVPENELFDRALENKKNKLTRTFDKLEEPRQEVVITTADKQLQLQESSHKIIPLTDCSAHKFHVTCQALSAGKGETYTDEQEYDEVWGINNVRYDQAVWIKGESMEPTFLDGDVALIVEQACVDYNGQICAVDDVENGKSYIKCVHVEEEGYRLVSINQTLDENGKLKYPDFILPYEESPRIIGRVVSHFTPIEK